MDSQYNYWHSSHIIVFDNCIKNVKTAPTAYTQSRGPVQGVQLAEMELQSSIYAHLSIKEATP